MNKIPVQTSIWLNVLRAGAAQAVVIGHLHHIFFATSLAEVGARASLLTTLVNFSGSWAHQSVMLFFVMSGFLIGGRVIMDLRAGHFDGPRYFIDRLTRLWIVILPALLLTALLDGIAFAYGQGAYVLTTRVPFYPAWWLEVTPYAWQTLVANVFFLQMITSFQFGSNLSLWSISNEFWYYLLLPTALGAMYLKRNARRWSGVAAAAVVVLLLMSDKPHDAGRPTSYFLLFLVWMLGALSYVYYDARWRRPLAIALVIGSAVMTVAIRRIFDGTVNSDPVVTALAVGLILLARDIPAQWLRRAADFFSGYSFSLYALHLPLAFCLVSLDHAVRDPVPIQWSTVARFIAYLVAINLAAVALWWGSERHTTPVRRWVLHVFEKMRPRSKAVDS